MPGRGLKSTFSVLLWFEGRCSPPNPKRFGLAKLPAEVDGALLTKTSPKLLKQISFADVFSEAFN